MSRSSTKRPVLPQPRTAAARDPRAVCQVCRAEAQTETDLVIHLVEQHGAVWASTNSFGLEDLMVPPPRQAHDDLSLPDPGGLLRRLLKRTG